MLLVVGANSSSASIVAGSKASASRLKFGLTPSSQTVSELTRKNGRIAELRQRLGDAAAGAEQRATLIGDDDLRTLTRRQVAFQRVGEMMHIDDGALDAGVGQTVERVIDQRLAADLDERLRDVAVIRPHARAQAGRQHDRAVRHHDVPQALSSPQQAFNKPSRPANSPHYSWSCGGRLAAYQALSGAKSGCASERCK